MKGKADIVSSLYRLPMQEGVYSIERLSLLAIATGRSSTLADEEECFNSRREIFNFLLKKMDVSASKGVFAPFEVVDSSQFLFQWRRGCGPKVDSRLARTPIILQELDKLSDRDYEFSCGVACSALGADKVFVTTGSRDKSVDFVALVPAYSSGLIPTFGARV